MRLASDPTTFAAKLFHPDTTLRLVTASGQPFDIFNEALFRQCFIQTAEQAFKNWASENNKEIIGKLAQSPLRMETE